MEKGLKLHCRFISHSSHRATEEERRIQREILELLSSSSHCSDYSPISHSSKKDPKEYQEWSSLVDENEALNETDRQTQNDVLMEGLDDIDLYTYMLLLCTR